MKYTMQLLAGKENRCDVGNVLHYSLESFWSVMNEIWETRLVLNFDMLCLYLSPKIKPIVMITYDLYVNGMCV